MSSVNRYLIKLIKLNFKDKRINKFREGKEDDR